MSVDVPEQVANVIRSLMETGAFRDEAHVLTEAIELLYRERDHEAWIERNAEPLRREIDQGIAQLNAGLAEAWDAPDIKRRGRAILAAERAPCRDA